MSIALKGRTGGYRVGGGRGKKGWYKGYWCDSSYELAWVMYALDHNISFQRNLEKFSYYWEDQERFYVPDFILSDGNYLEIKGYVSAREQAKFKAFPHSLTVLLKTDLANVFAYVHSKYGESFIEHYESKKYVIPKCSLCGRCVVRHNKSGKCKICLLSG